MGRFRWKQEYDHSEFRNKILNAFRLLRSRKVMARANFMCCGSCASYDMWTKMEEKGGYIGGVFWHKQSEEGLEQDKPGEGELHIGFGANYHNITERDNDLEDAWIGWMLYDALVESGLHPDWKGDSGVKMLVSEKIEANQPLDVESCLSDICTD